MIKKLTTFFLVAALATTALAATPTGTVTVKYAVANGDGSCPASGSSTFITANLDASGNYSYGSNGASFTPGTYCFYAHYNGGSNGGITYQPSDAATITHVVLSNTQSTTTTQNPDSPEPSVQGNNFSVSGSVVAP